MRFHGSRGRCEQNKRAAASLLRLLDTMIKHFIILLVNPKQLLYGKKLPLVCPELTTKLFTKKRICHAGLRHSIHNRSSIVPESYTVNILWGIWPRLCHKSFLDFSNVSLNWSIKILLHESDKWLITGLILCVVPRRVSKLHIYGCQSVSIVTLYKCLNM